MPNTTRGVGLFTAENIVAAIRAIPESDGTYRDVARKAEQYGGNFHHQTISNWVRHGQADIEAGQPSTAYARFTVNGGGKVDHMGGSTSGCGVGKLYRPPPSIRLIISLWRVRRMYPVEMYVQVRRACMVEGMSVRDTSRRFHPLLGKVAAVQHPHRLRMLQPGTQILLQPADDRVVIPAGLGKKTLQHTRRRCNRL